MKHVYFKTKVNMLMSLLKNSDGSVPYLPILISLIIGAIIALAYVKFKKPAFILDTIIVPIQETATPPVVVKVKEEFKALKSKLAKQAMAPPEIYLEEEETEEEEPTEEEETEEDEDEEATRLDFGKLE